MRHQHGPKNFAGRPTHPLRKLPPPTGPPGTLPNRPCPRRHTGLLVWVNLRPDCLVMHDHDRGDYQTNHDALDNAGGSEFLDPEGQVDLGRMAPEYRY